MPTSVRHLCRSWLVGLCLLAAVTAATPATAQDSVPSDVSFALRRSFLEELLTRGPGGRSVGARWSVSVRLGAHSSVHKVGADCELHVAARLPNNRIVAIPRGLVVEPPNVCKERVPQIRQTGSRESAWTDYFDSIVDHSCQVTGFPRIFTEHSTGGAEGDGGGSNPNHVVEIHPATQLGCGADTIDFVPLIRIYSGMRKISEASARACLAERRLFVRQRGSGDQIRYEFREQGAKSSNGRCGNFAVVDVHLGKDYLRTLSNGGDHVALAQAWIGDNGPYPLKLYTFNGTAVDSAVAALISDPDELAQLDLEVHGVLTYDYVTIAQAVRDGASWLPADSLAEWKEVSGPLSLVVFGVAR